MKNQKRANAPIPPFLAAGLIRHSYRGLLLLLLCLSCSPGWSQNLIANGSFEDKVIDTSIAGSEFITFMDTTTPPIDNWTVTVPDTIDAIDMHDSTHLGMGCPPPPGGGRHHIDLNPKGSIRQSGFSMTGGKQYILSFWTSVHLGLGSVAGGTASAQVSLTNLSGGTTIFFIDTIAKVSADVDTWVEQSYSFTAPGSGSFTARIDFESLGSDYTDGGVLIDSVVLREDFVSSADCSDTCYWKVTGNNILYPTRNILGTLSNDDVRLYTNNTQRGVWTKGGYFGWNTAFPTALMHVDVSGAGPTSGVRLQGLPSASDTLLLTVDDNGNVHKRAFADNGVLNACATINKLPKTSTATGDLTCSQIYDNGVNVGINTTAPAAQLHQVSTVAGSVVHKLSNSATGNLSTDGFDMGIDGIGNAEIRQRENLGINLYTNNAQRAVLDASGNLGIGIANPAALLHQSAAAGSATAHKFSNGTTGDLSTDGFEVGINPAGAGEIRQRENQGINLYTNNTQRAVLDASGNMGLGISSPTALLHQSAGFSTATKHKFSNSTVGNAASDGFDIGIASDGTAELRQNESLGINFHTAGTQRAMIAASGIIGMGTTTPVWNFKLTVDNRENTNIRPLNKNAIQAIALQPNCSYGYGIEVIASSLGGTKAVAVNDSATGDRAIMYGNGMGWFKNRLTIGAVSPPAGELCWDNTPANDHLLYVEGSGYFQNGNFIASDRRFKKDIQTVANAAALISRLNPVTYTFDTERFAERNFRKGSTYGFIAQELKEVVPSSVNQENDGYYSVDYTVIIPILTKALQEQQAQITQQQQEIEALKQMIKTQQTPQNSTTTAVGEKAREYENAYLEQNTPNPFSVTTEIKYQLPQATQTAILGVYDMNGRQLKSFTLNTSQVSGSVLLQAGDLQAGMYLYSLIIDGRIFDTKRMVLSAQ